MCITIDVTLFHFSLRGSGTVKETMLGLKATKKSADAVRRGEGERNERR